MTCLFGYSPGSGHSINQSLGSLAAAYVLNQAYAFLSPLGLPLVGEDAFTEYRDYILFNGPNPRDPSRRRKYFTSKGMMMEKGGYDANYGLVSLQLLGTYVKLSGDSKAEDVLKKFIDTYQYFYVLDSRYPNGEWHAELAQAASRCFCPDFFGSTTRLWANFTRQEWRNTKLAVRKNPNLCARKSAAVDDRRVAQRVGDHQITSACERGDDADVCHVARTEDQRGLGPEKFGEFRLERLVDLEIAVDQSRTSRRAAELARRSRGRLDDLRVMGEVEVVAARKEQGLAAVDRHPRGLRARHDAHLPMGAAFPKPIQQLARAGFDAHR